MWGVTMPKSGDETVDHGPGILRRLALGSFYLSIALLAVVGLIGLLLETYSWFIGTRWRPEDVNVLLSHDSPTMHIAREAWSDLKYLLQYGAYFIAAVALLIAVTQIKTISKLMSDYLNARGSIYQLAATMSNAEETAKRLSGQADRLSQLEPIIKLMSEKVEEAVLKIGDLQRLPVSERIDASANSFADPTHPGPFAPTTTNADEDTNWEKLREYWNANGARLDLAIERIPEKRKRTKYSRMDRRNYPAIINGLADDGYISETARRGSLDLHATFVRFRPRNREIPDKVIGDLGVLDKILENEFAQLPDIGERLPPPVDNQVREPV